MNEITILGAYGTKGEETETSSFWVDAHNVIDAGNLLRSLKADSAQIEAIWLTHSHLDHIIDIAYILDSYFADRTKPLKLMGLPQTLEAIQKHFLNDIIWPDFSKIKLMYSDAMSVEYHPIELAEVYQLDESTSIEAFKTDHTVASCGFIVRRSSTALLITADTYELESVFDAVKVHNEITAVVIECSFPSSMRHLAQESKHLTPELLFEKIRPLDASGLKLYINHIKPLYEDKIREEIAQKKGIWECKVLKDGDKILF
ncbi:MAG: MBL fold metallo-hydrolase [Campylobacterota bacterium]|nr:MBL fold metallo-hydrolase [Campylobacterota bacterium]